MPRKLERRGAMRIVQAALTAACVWVVLPVAAAAQDAKAVVEAASKAMGVDTLTSITYSGSAAQGNFGQSRTISFGLASTAIRNYTRTFDFTQPASHATGTATPPSVTGAPPSESRPYDQLITPTTPAWAQQLQIWVTPWGFLRGAAANGATVRARTISEVPYKLVTWAPPQKAPSGQAYKVVGYVNPENLVDRVETWVEHPVFGDMHIEVTYSDFRDIGGFRVPVRISQKQVGMETFVVAITQARVNPPNLAALMTPAPAAGPAPAAAATAPQPPAVASERLADGVYRITGGYVAMAVEFRDHVVVLEGGQNESRGLAILAETKRLFPTKRIKYVVNTHPHFDHAGGLAPFVAEGITIVGDDNSKFFMEQSLSSPRTLVGDALGRTRKKAKVEGVIEKMVLKDDTRTLELHHVEKLEHSDAMLIAYLPKEKILFTADFNVPGPGQHVSPSIETLVQNIERLQLDFDRHVTVHAPNPDRPLTKADLLALVQRGTQP